MYRYLTADLMTRKVDEELPLEDVSFEEHLNNIGSMEAKIDKYSEKATKKILDPGRTLLIVERQNRIVWSGIFWDPERLNERVKLDCASLESYYMRLMIRQTLHYKKIEQFQIVRNLLDYANAKPGANIGVTADTHNSGVIRTRKYYHSERSKILERIDQMSAVRSGFDYNFETVWVGRELQHRLRLYYPRRGKRTKHVFEYGPHFGDYELPSRASKRANVVDALGKGEGDAQVIASAEDATDVAVGPRLETTRSYNSVGRRSTLQAHADTDLAALKQDTKTLKLFLLPGIIPRMDEYVVGDTVRVRINDGYYQIDDDWRIVGRKVNPNDFVNEEVTLFLVNESAAIDDTL